MMARFPAPMAGWSGIVPTVVDTIVAALAEAMPDRVPAGHHGAARRRGGVLRHPSQDQAALRGAEHRGRRLGRPAVRGRRVRHRLGLPGRRAQRLDRGHRAEMPGGGREPRAAHRIPAAPASIRGGLGIDMRVRNLVEGKWNFEHAAAQQMPALGHAGRHARRARRLSAASCRGESEFTHDGRQPHPGAGRRRGDRAHRRRRRLGRSAGARSRAGARRRGGGAHLAGGGAQALRRGAARQHVARRKRRPGGCENG